MNKFVKHSVIFGNRLLDALLPEDCVCCGTPLVDGERYLCLRCRLEMPLVRINSLTDNFIHETLASTKPIDKAVSLYRYRRDGLYTKLIQQAKYAGRPKLARWLGRQLAEKYAGQDFFKGIDYLVPVPLSWTKFLKRGYNQSAEIAKGMQELCGIPVRSVMTCKPHKTQTRKSASGRHSNIKDIYGVKNGNVLRGDEHVVLIDDVITTGSTMMACVDALRQRYSSLNVSVASVAITEL